MMDLFRVRRMWRPRGELKPRYDVVIVGGGSHGLATAYYLAKNHGITNVAVLERSYIGSGAAGRNTTIIRANYRTPEGAEFYAASVKLYESLSADLDFNLLFSQQGHLTLAHSDRAMITMTERAEVNRLLGIDSRVIEPAEIAKLCPEMNLSQEATWPVMGALYHPPGGIIRHDAVVWGYAIRACERGVELHQRTEVLGMDVANNKVTRIRTNRGDISAGVVVQCVAGYSSVVAKMVGLKLPIRSYPLQAMVTHPIKPFLDPMVSSTALHCYISQSARGELVIGGGSDPYELYNTRSTLELKEGLAASALELFPFIGELKVLRQWAGITDMTPDYRPIMGQSPLSN